MYKIVLEFLNSANEIQIAVIQVAADTAEEAVSQINTLKDPSWLIQRIEANPTQ
jgi:predicted negative regulator of RcsB-dependent stress response